MTNVPMLTPNGQIDGVAQNFGFMGSTRFMSDAGYVRLKTVTLSYQLPKSILDVLFKNTRSLQDRFYA